MKKSSGNIEIFLKQGEVYFGDRDTRIRTVLGSCVAITMWHPDLLVGGMCHYMLATRDPSGQKFHSRIRNSSINFPSRRSTVKKTLDGRYADEALELMFSEVQRSGAHAREYQIKLFGGGHMFPATTKPGNQHVGVKNIAIITHLLAYHGLNVSAEHMGGIGHRTLIFDICNGDVWMKQQPPLDSPGANCEIKEICPSV